MPAPQRLAHDLECLLTGRLGAVPVPRVVVGFDDEDASTGAEEVGQGAGGGQRGALLFVLGCVAVAGLFGAATASRKIVFVQTVPAALAIAAVLFLR